MTHLKKKYTILVGALIILVCLLISVFSLCVKKEESASADIVTFDSATNGLDISGTTLNGLSDKSFIDPFHLVIPKEIRIIPAGAFKGTNVVSIKYEAGRSSDAYLRIGEASSTAAGAFADCISLQTVDLPDSTNESGRVGANTFNGCTALKSVTVPTAAYSVWYNTYKGCSALETVTFRDTYTVKRNIYDSAFSGCSSLINIDTSKVVLINANAFYNCRMLTHLDLSGLTSNAGSNAFSGCVRLVDVKLSTNANVTNKTAGGLSYLLNTYTDGNGSKLVKIPREVNGEVVSNYVFCQKTNTTGAKTSFLASSYDNSSSAAVDPPNQNVSTGFGVTCTNGNWYLVGYEGDGTNNDESYDVSKPMNFPTLDELRTATGDSSITKYDINNYAFYMIHAQNVKIPDFVEIVGNNAFNTSAMQVADLSGASKLITAGYFGFANNTGVVVYLPDRVNNNKHNTDDVIWMGRGCVNGVPSLIVMPNYKSYDALRQSMHSYLGSFVDVLTYYVPIELHYTGADGGVETEYRLWNKTYTYVEQEGSRLWEYNTAKTIPVQKGYSSSVWYSAYNAQTGVYSGKVTESGLNTLLSNSVPSNYTIHLYAHTENKPNGSSPDDDSVIETTPYMFDSDESYGLTVSEINRLLAAHAGSGVSMTDKMSAEITFYANAAGVPFSTDLPSTIRNAGTYELTIQLNPAYGAWEKPAVITVMIAQQEIVLSDYDNHKFQLTSGVNLRDGRLWLDADKTPHQEQFDKTDPSIVRTPIDVENAYVRYNNAEQKIELVNVLEENGVPVFNVISNDTETTAERKAYTTTFSLSLTYDGKDGTHYDFSNNYCFVSNRDNEDDPDLNRRGVALFPAGSSAFITKVWYIVDVDNYFAMPLSEGQALPDSYEVASWVYGLGNTVLPKVLYGAAENISFTLRYTNAEYGKDGIAVTPVDGTYTDDKSTLSKALVHESYSEFADYINASMPVGRYELVLFFPDVYTHNVDGSCVYDEPSGDDISNYTKHDEIYTVYYFDVTTAPLSDSRVTEKVEAIKSGLTETEITFEYDGESKFLDQTNTTLVTALTDLNVTKTRAGEWAKSVYDDCFGGFGITYNLEKAQNNYYAAADKCDVTPVDPGRYIVYYQLSAKNWQSLVNPNSDDAGSANYRRNYYFNVIIEKSVEVPTVASVTYTGNSVSPLITYHDNSVALSVVWDADDDYVEGGAHYVTFRLADYPYYYWAQDDNANIQITNAEARVKFIISAIANDWALQPVINGWTYGSAENVIAAKSYYGNSEIKFTYYKGIPDGTLGEYTVPAGATGYATFEALKNANKTDGKLNADNYYVLAKVAGTSDYTELSFVCTFAVAKNTKSAPVLAEATYNGGAQKVCLSGTAVELADTDDYTVSYASDIKYAGQYDVTFTLKDKINYKWSGAAADDGVYTAKFIVKSAQNGWVQSPSVISWQWNQYDRAVNLFSAVPAYFQKSSGVTVAQQAVTWFIYSDANGQNLVNKTYTDTESNTSYNLKDGFTLVAENGKWVVPAWVEQLLNELDAQTWYLRAVVEGGYDENNTADTRMNYDFGGLGGADTTPVPFVIIVAANSWEKSSNVYGWSYGDYKNGTSITLAEPRYGNKADGSAVTYYIRNNTSDTVLFSFNLDADGLVKQADLTKLNNLSAGNYRVTVYVAAAANKYGALSVSYPFVIDKAANAVSAQITGWKYGEYADSKVAISYNGESAKFTLFNSNSVKEGEYATVADLKAKLASLDSGTYSVEISVTGGANYVSTTTPVTVVFKIEGGVNSFVNGTPIIKVGGNSVTSFGYTGNTDGVSLDHTVTHGNDSAAFTVWYYKANLVGGVYVKSDTPLAASGMPTAVGAYYVVVKCSGVTNYEDLEGELFFEITKVDNVWTENGAPAVGGGLIYGDNGSFTWTAPSSVLGGETVVTIDGTAVDKDSVLSKLQALGAGNHTVEVEVKGTANFNALIKTINFTVNKADNVWVKAPEIVTADGKNGWAWGAYKPDTIKTAFTVYDARFENAEVSYVISSTGGDAYSLTSLASANVGNYTLTVTAKETNNYKSLTATVDFQIFKASNDWVSIPSKTKTYSWDYGDTIDVETKFGAVAAKYGVVAVSYRKSGSAVVYNDLPTAVGNYEIVYKVVGTTNYDGIIESVPFEIKGTKLTAWTVGYGVSSYWAWNGYDKNTNVFKGVPASGGKVEYAVYDADNKTELIGKFKLDENGFVSDAIETKLKALEAGKYTLRVYVSEKEGYGAFEEKTEIEVALAENSWTVSPTVVPWVVGAWSAGDGSTGSVGNVPQAMAKYGDVEIVIKKINTDGTLSEPYYKATHKQDGSVKEDINLFDGSTDLNFAGAYRLIATVATVDGKYAGKDGALFTESVEFQVFASSVDIPANYWRTLPAIDNWTAGDKASVPQGAPLRDDKANPTLSFTYFSLKYDATARKWVVDKQVALDKITEAGRYRMVVEVYPEQTTHRDHLRAEIDFNVDQRVNNWTVSPSIADFFLSDGPSAPLYETVEKSEVTVLYKRKDAANSTAVAEMPNEPGEYTMVVTAKAAHCEDLYAEYDFKVLVSTNEWLELPTIENYSEEFGPVAPVGASKYGEIVYTWYTADGTPLDECPTKEGEYIMVATVELYGFETLTAEYAFTVTPAFDKTFVIIDIVLGVIAFIGIIVLIVIGVKKKRLLR
ncbi:MAG: leucine-rich repeat domain-containing protein [Clostridiales bacterium]|nr:leucine-rich repeat domain-containing protein [Clostridiales bacterium]